MHNLYVIISPSSLHTITSRYNIQLSAVCILHHCETPESVAARSHTCSIT